MLLCLCKPSGFCLSPLLPSGVGLSHCPSSPYCSTAARCRRSSRLLVLSQSPLPLHSLSTGMLFSSDCPVLCLLGVTSPAVSQAPLRGLLHSSPGNPGTPQGGIWARTSPLFFRGMNMSLDLPIKELKLPTGTPHSFLSPPQLWKILSNPGFNWAKAPFDGNTHEKPWNFNPKGGITINVIRYKINHVLLFTSYFLKSCT